jgi:hypothetical protein
LSDSDFVSEDFEQEEPERLPTLKFLTPGIYEDGTKGKADRFVGTITRIGAIFDNKPQENQKGDPGSSYPIELLATFVDMTAIKRQGGQKAYDPPEVGDEVVWFVKVGSANDRGIQQAVKDATGGKGNGVDEGAKLGIVFTEERKTKHPMPFKRLSFKYAAPVKAVPKEDPFADGGAFGDDEAPF